jgi:transposase
MGVMENQSTLMELAPSESGSEPAGSGRERKRNLAPKLKAVNRSQAMWIPVDVEELIGPDHKVRAIWDLTGELDLRALRERIVSRQENAGAPAWDPRLLVSIWVYAYSEGIGAAREIERLMEHEPGLLWLSGIEKVNHHTLSDFRVDHKAALDDLFTQMLGLLESEGYVKLERVMHDGTKIRTLGGADSFRREGTLERHLERARQVVKEMGDPREPEPVRNLRREAAQRRAGRERVERLERAAAELRQMQAGKAGAEEKEKARVSLTEPEARLMKHGDNAIAPSYNAQLSTDAEQKVIVSCQLTQCSSDAAELPAGMDLVKANLGRYPTQAVVDGGYTNQATMAAMEERHIDLIGSLGDPSRRTAAALKASGIDPAFGAESFLLDEAGSTLQCPAGKCLRYVRQSHKRGRRYHQYQARGSDCRQCELRSRCCPKNAGTGRTVSVLVEEAPRVAAFRRKMETAEARQIYKQRGAVAEFPNAWIKERIGLRKFRLRGLAKAGIELLWACLTYNLMQWIRLRRKPPAVAATA